MGRRDKSPEFIEFLPWQKKVKVAPGKTVLELAIKAKIPLAHSCGGNGSCGTCLVHLKSHEHQDISRNSVEEEMAQERSFANHERLACQLEALAHMEIEVPFEFDSSGDDYEEGGLK